MPQATELAEKKSMAEAIEHCLTWAAAARAHAAKLYLDGDSSPETCRLTVALTSAIDLDPTDDQVALQCLFGTALSKELNCSVLLPAEALQRFAMSDADGPTAWELPKDGAYVRVASFATFVSAREATLGNIAEHAGRVTRRRSTFVQRLPIVLVASNTITADQVVADSNKLSIVLCSAGHTNPRLYSGAADRYVWVSRVGPFSSNSATLFAFERPSVAGVDNGQVHISISSPLTGREFHGQYPVTFETVSTEMRGLVPPGVGAASSFKARRDATIRAIWDDRKQFLDRLQLGADGRETSLVAAEYEFESYWPELMELWPETWDELVFSVENKAIDEGGNACVRVVTFDEIFALNSDEGKKRSLTGKQVQERLSLLAAPMRHRRTHVPGDTAQPPSVVLVIKDFGEVERSIHGQRGQAADESAKASQLVSHGVQTGGKLVRPVLSRVWHHLHSFSEGKLNGDGNGVDAIVLLYSRERVKGSQGTDDPEYPDIKAGKALRSAILKKNAVMTFRKHTSQTSAAIVAWYEHFVPLPAEEGKESFAPAEFVLPRVAQSTLSMALDRFWDALYSDEAVPSFDKAISEAGAGLTDGVKEQRELKRFVEERQRLKDHLISTDSSVPSTTSEADYTRLFTAISDVVCNQSKEFAILRIHLDSEVLAGMAKLAKERVEGMLGCLEALGYVEKRTTGYLVLKPICLSAPDDKGILA